MKAHTAALVCSSNEIGRERCDMIFTLVQNCSCSSTQHTKCFVLRSSSRLAAFVAGLCDEIFVEHSSYFLFIAVVLANLFTASVD